MYLKSITINHGNSEDIYDCLLTILPPLIPRKDIEKLLGGLISRGHLANLDYRGEGPPKLQVGRHIGYPRDTFILWLKSRYGNGKPKEDKGQE